MYSIRCLKRSEVTLCLSSDNGEMREDSKKNQRRKQNIPTKTIRPTTTVNLLKEKTPKIHLTNSSCFV